MAELRAMESVVVYSSPTCVHCQAAKAFLTASGVDFDEVDVREDVEGREELIELTGQLAVPVIVVRRDRRPGLRPAPAPGAAGTAARALVLELGLQLAQV